MFCLPRAMSTGTGVNDNDGGNLTVLIRKHNQEYTIINKMSQIDNNTPTSARLENADKNAEINRPKNINTNLRYRSVDVGPFVVYVEHNSLNIGNVHPMKIGGILKNLPEFNSNITEVARVGRNRIKIVLKTASAANLIVEKQIFEANELRAYIPQHLTEKKAIIRNVDTRISEEELIEIIESDIPVRNVQRLTRIIEKNNEKIRVPKQTVIVTFAGLQVPTHVYINYNRCAIEPYIPKVIQCLKCLRYGHISRQCNAKSERCKTCGNMHEEGADEPCTAFCIHCKSSSHKSISKECPLYEKQAAIKKIMSERNLGFMEAKEVYEHPSFANTLKLNNRFSMLDGIEQTLERTGYNYPPLPPVARRARIPVVRGRSYTQPSKAVPHDHPLHTTKRRKTIDPLENSNNNNNINNPSNVSIYMHAATDLEKVKNKLIENLTEFCEKLINKENSIDAEGDAPSIRSVIEKSFQELNVNNGEFMEI